MKKNNKINMNLYNTNNTNFNLKSHFLGLGVTELVFCIFFICIILYSGKSVVKEWKVDANDVKEIKQYVIEVLNIKYYDIKSIMLKNLWALKNILEQRDISEEERLMILKFLEEMHKWGLIWIIEWIK